jgi:hypothetical protein
LFAGHHGTEQFSNEGFVGRKVEVIWHDNRLTTAAQEPAQDKLFITTNV